MNINHRNIEEAVKKILKSMGENPEREGLLDTPSRVGKMYEEIFAGINQDPRDQFDVIFSENHDEVVIVKEIPFYSMCEHHLLPFYGNAHVAYLPKNGKIAGLSKLARAVDVTAKRPQLQERMTDTIADAIMEKLDPYGVLVLIEAEHMCMTMRGIKKPGSKTVTLSARGVYREDAQLRGEVLHLIRS